MFTFEHCAAALALLLVACGPSEPGDGSTSDDTTTGDESTSSTSTTSGGSTSDGSGSTGSTSGSSTTGEDPTTSSSSGSTSTSSTTGEGTSSTGVDPTTTGGVDPFCGDGLLDEGEECDDGNDVDDDGCDADCTISQWRQMGVATNVSVSDLIGWEVCYLSTFEVNGEKWATLPETCNTDEVIVGCRPAGSDVMKIAALGEHVVVFAQVNSKLGEYQNNNGVRWGWGAGYGDFVIGPQEGDALCASMDNKLDENRLCRSQSGMGSTWGHGVRCGALPMQDDSAWEFVVFTSTK